MATPHPGFQTALFLPALPPAHSCNLHRPQALRKERGLECSGKGARHVGIRGSSPRGTPAGRLGPKQGGWGLLGSSWDPKTGSEAAPAPETQDQRGTRQHLWRLQGEGTWGCRQVGGPWGSPLRPIARHWVSLGPARPKDGKGRLLTRARGRCDRCPADGSASRRTWLRSGHGQLVVR